MAQVKIRKKKTKDSEEYYLVLVCDNNDEQMKILDPSRAHLIYAGEQVEQTTPACTDTGLEFRFLKTMLKKTDPNEQYTFMVLSGGVAAKIQLNLKPQFDRQLDLFFKGVID